MKFLKQEPEVDLGELQRYTSGIIIGVGLFDIGGGGKYAGHMMQGIYA